MLKLLITILAFMGLCAPLTGSAIKCDASATDTPTLVQVSDKTFIDFYNDILLHNKAKGVNMTFESVNIEPLEGKDYDSFLLMARRPNILGKHGAAISIFSNKAGCVSKIVIMAPTNNSESILDAHKAEYIILGALGIPDNIDKAFMRDLLARRTPFQIALWNNWSHRNIVVSHGPSPESSSLFYIRIIAYDKMFSRERKGF